MITIDVTPNWVTIKNLDGEQEEYLGSVLTVKVPNYWFSTAYKNGGWDGSKKFYGIRKGVFFALTGFFGVVVRELYKMEVEFVVNNPHSFKDEDEFNDDSLKGIVLKNYQMDTLCNMRRLGRGIIKGSTGSGKTEIAIAFTKWFLENNNGIVLFLTHRKMIFDQVWDERFKKRLTLVEAKTLTTDSRKSWGYFGERETGYQTITLAMTQTLSGHIKEQTWLENVKVAFCDECHAVETYMRKAGKVKVHILSKLPNCYHRFGMSATPFKKSGKKDEKYHKLTTMSNFGDVIEVEHKHKVKAKISMIPVELGFTGTDYQDAIDKSMTSPRKLREIKNLLLKHKDKKTLIFVRYVEHGELLSNHLKLPFIYGDTKSDDRLDACKDFRDGKFNAMIVSSIFIFGVDLPEVDCIIFAWIGKSYINVIQSIGRGLREFEDKKELLVYDFYEKDRSHLQKHSEERLNHYKSEGFEIDDTKI